jgi:hypothetical protein
MSQMEHKPDLALHPRPVAPLHFEARSEPKRNVGAMGAGKQIAHIGQQSAGPLSAVGRSTDGMAHGRETRSGETRS